MYDEKTKIIERCPNCKKKLYRLQFPYYKGKGIWMECVKVKGGCGWSHDYNKTLNQY